TCCSGVGAAYVFGHGHANGDACSSSSDCATGQCADGVCCDAPCDGECNACSVAAGAPTDGHCAILGAGSPGSPACAPLACNGFVSSCTSCGSDGDCTPDRYCAPDGTCTARKAQASACDRVADCMQPGCRECSGVGVCSDGFCCDT